MSNHKEKYLALSGGIGGAKLALGLMHTLDSEQLTIVANTGDDFEHFGLSISPDIDTLLYTLAGINNKELGWGRSDETWSCLDAAKQLGMESWFQLGDKDLALHLYRTNRLNEGASLSVIVQELTERFGIEVKITPMSDQPVRTMVETELGVLPFQEYFVKHRCEPKVQKVSFAGINTAVPSTNFLNGLNESDLQSVIVCPSNPFLSVEPILSLNGIRDLLGNTNIPVIVVSPIVQGQALKGPTAKMMQELGLDTDVLAIARLYKDIAQAIVIDNSDAKYKQELEDIGLNVLSTNTIMNTLDDRITLAKDIIEFSKSALLQ